MAASAGGKFVKVTSTDELADGDEIVLCRTDKKKALSTDFYNTVDVTFDGNDLIENDKTAVITLRKTQSYINLLYKGKYIYYKSNKLTIGEETTITKTKCNIDEKSSLQIYWINNSKRYYIFSDANCTKITIKQTQQITDNYISIYKRKTTDAITLSDVTPTDLTNYKGQQVRSLTLSRSFKADGGWYTLCLPFKLTKDDISEKFKGAEFDKFTGIAESADGITLKFTQVTETEAGIPYLIKPVQDIPANLVFSNKLIETSTPSKTTFATSSGDEYSFTGVFSPTTISADNIRFLGGDDGKELLRPEGEGTMNGFRAYFDFPKGSVRKARISAGNTTTPISHIMDDTCRQRNNIYDMSGASVGNDIHAIKPGLYIINGKKTIIH